MFDLKLFGHIQHRKDVIDVAVHTAAGEQSHDMYGFSVLLCRAKCVDIGFILEEVSFLDLFRDLGKILEHYTACADIGVPDFRIAHLSVGKSNIQAGGRQLAFGILLEQSVQIRGLGLIDGVSVAIRRQAKTVHNYKN